MNTMPNPTADLDEAPRTALPGLPAQSPARPSAAPAQPPYPPSPAPVPRPAVREPRGCLYALSQPPLMLFLAVIAVLLAVTGGHDLFLL